MKKYLLAAACVLLAAIPGSALSQTAELAYDDGECNLLFPELHGTQFLRQQFVAADFGIASPFRVGSVRLYSNGVGASPLTFDLIFNDLAVGPAPVSTLVGNYTIPNDGVEGWREFTVPPGLVLESTDFYVELWTTGGNGFVCADTDPPIDGRSEVDPGGTGTGWGPLADGDLMIRVAAPAVADSDLDGVPDDIDNCPQAPNRNQQDSDYPTTPEFAYSDGGDVCDACPTEWDGGASPEAPSSTPCAFSIVVPPAAGGTAVRIIDAKPEYTFGEEALLTEVCVVYDEANVGEDILVIRPNCSNVNLRLTYDGVELSRRYPLARPLGIVCPDDSDPAVDVISAAAYTATEYCIECPLDDYFVIDPEELGVQSGTAVNLELSGRYVTTGIIDPDPPGAYIPDPGSFPHDWCLGADGRLALTPLDSDLGSQQLTFIYPQEVNIDIKPGSDDNPINLGSNGNIPVAILSSPAFDATTVNPFTVSMAGANVILKGKAQAPKAQQTDVNGDGLLDLLVHIDTEALQLSDGETTAYVKAQTYMEGGSPGTYVMGSDIITVVPQ